MLSGSCNCNAITFTVTGQVRSISNCHCGQCRKQSGNVWASAVAEQANITITGTPRWYRSSASAARGFCPDCGCFLFWRHDDETSMSFALGALDGPTGLRIEKHIFVADKGDYYDIADDLPQHEH
ncbi:GFA family protein [Sulfitobacter aestuariivivens]|uniref:GFA family protein n=1 Tax=Sulfitobacter aestuariivivens TaxID=2766981 RepID=A0A927HHY3_9RHOB|nr:GFA family protein [Sulfitobacter aestuariivivens]MBD3665695.1 GFA family protein [Sulfitobacter aestuariivivens]